MKGRNALLDTITELSHEFGTSRYVRGGGGNTSAKDADTLWVKPSGTTLAGMTPDTFVALDRAAIDRLYTTEPPAETAAREALVRTLMGEAVQGEGGRPSVEAPLHNAFGAALVVHTHAAWVNGLTCARDGAAACAELFPDAMWMDYVDPGYTLCMEVRNHMDAWRAGRGAEPAVVFLKNHGIFVAGDSADAVRSHYAAVMNALEHVYREAGLPLAPDAPPAPPEAGQAAAVRAVFGDEAAFLAAAGGFECAAGPVSPDHMVYAKAYPFTGELTAQAADTYRAERGYAPRVVHAGDTVFGLGRTQRHADLALDLALDGAYVVRLAEAFGGIEYMTDSARKFIENWEVESYRDKQVG